MHKNRIVSSFMLVMFLFAIAFGAGAPQTFAAGTNLTDVNGNWAQSQIENLAGKGIISGYTDNTFKPANNITRAEFMVIVNRAFSYTNSASVSFKDVKSTDWFAGEVAKASAAGYISGYQDGTMKPNQNITRQEVASIMTRILKLDTSNSTVTFKDAKDIPAWSVNAVAAMAKAGLIKGYPDGTFKAINPITRGEVAAIVYSAISTDTATATVYSQAGTYGPETGSATIEGNVTISAADVILQNTVITGNLLVAESVGEGNVTLKNVTVKGDTTINGGGAHSVNMDNCKLANVFSNKKSVHISCVNGTTVVTITLNNGATVDVAPGTNIAGVKVSTTGEVTLNGNFGSLTVDSPNAVVTVASGTIASLTIANNATNATVNVAHAATVTALTVNAVVAIKGTGTISTANYNVNGVTSTIKASTVNTATGVTAPTSTSGGGGGGGGGSTTSGPTISGVTVGGIAPTINGTTLTFAVVPTDRYKTGTATLSANVDFCIQYGSIDIDGTATTSDTNANLVTKALQLLAANGGTPLDGVLGSTLISKSPVTITLTKTGGTASTVYTINFVEAAQAAPTLSDLSIGVTSDDTLTVTPAISGTTLTFAVDPAVRYDTGAATLSANASYVIVSGNDVNVTGTATTTDDLVQIALDALEAAGGTPGDGVLGSTLIARGTVTITLTAGSAQTVYTVNFEEPAPVTLQSIAITKQATKKSYTVGEELDITGLEVTGTYSDNSSKVETVTTANVTGFDSSAAVTGQVLTVTVGGKSTTYTVDIVTAPVATGTYTITQVNAFNASLGITVSNLSNANYFNVYRTPNGLINPTPKAINVVLPTMPAAYATIGSLEVWVYSDAAGTDKIAAFTLSGDGASGTLVLK